MSDTQKAFIAFDGLDGSGKETQTKLLIDHFKSENKEYRYLSFPTYNEAWSKHLVMYLNGEFGSDPEAVNAYAASSFFASDRYCSYMLDWKKDYESGKVILSNRYTTANCVHQLSKLPEEEWDSFLEWLYDYEFNKLGLPKPDLCIYLCIPPEVAKNNIVKRSAENAERHMDIHEKSASHLEKSYRAALYSASKLGWKTVNCAENGEMRSIDDIHDEIVSIIREWEK